MATPDFLNMSDEDMQKFDTSTIVMSEEDNQDEEVKDDVVDDDQEDTEGSTDEDNKDTEVDGDPESEKDETDTETDEKKVSTTSKVVDDASEKKVETTGDDKAKSGDEGAKDESVVIDYENEYKKVFAPFKANGRDIQVNTPDEAIALMQMGANYNKKMAALKPNLKLMKMLEANGLLTEEKLSYLIDLDKKDPAAINKLVADSKIDPLDLSTDKASEYKPNNHTVDDREMELDAVLSELDGTEHYNRTLEVVSTKWDKASKMLVAEHPQILKIINDHMALGIYDRIHTQVERDRTFGRLNGLSDLEAYKQVGDAMHAQGAFNDLGHQTDTKPAVKVVVQPKLKPADEDKLRDKKRAASSTKTAIPSKGLPADFNPLSMTDEEFAKFKPI